MTNDEFKEKVAIQEEKLLDIIQGITIDLCLNRYQQAYELYDQIPSEELAERHIDINHEAVKRVLIELGKVFDHTTCVVEEMQGRTDVSNVLSDVDFKDIVEVDHD